MILSLALVATLSSLGQTPSLSALVTYQTRAARASVVLKELGQTSKLNLEWSTPMANEVLLLSVKDQPIGEVLKRIATVTSGEWKHEGSILRLVPSTVIRRDEDRTEVKEKVQALRKWLDEKAKLSKTKADEAAKRENALKTPPPKGISNKLALVLSKRVSALNSRLIAQNSALITSLLESIPAESLALMPSQDRVVYSTNPTRTQVGFGDKVLPILNDFVSSHNQAINDVETAYENDRKSDPSLRQFYSPSVGNRKVIDNVAKATLTVDQNSSGRTISFERLSLTLYDSTGGWAYFYNEPPNAGDPTGDGADRSTPLNQIEVSKESRELCTVLVDTDESHPKLSKELLAKVIRPDQFEPLSFACTDAVLGFALPIGQPIVADLPDDWFQTILGKVGEGGLTEAFVKKEFTDGDSISQIPDPSFTVLKPRFPSTSRSNRLDRLALAKLLRAASDQSIAHLDDLAAYAMSTPDPNDNPISDDYLDTFVPGFEEQSTDYESSWPMLRFYGHLSREARSTLESGNPIAFSNLSLEERSLIEQMVYGTDPELTIVDAKNPIPAGLPDTLTAQIGGRTFDFRDEPTELLPNGLPANGFVEARVSREPFALATAPQNSFSTSSGYALGPEDLAMQRLVAERDKDDSDSPAPKPVSLRLGVRDTISFTFHFLPAAYMRRLLKDHSIDRSSSEISADHLPSDFERRIAEYTTLFKSNPQIIGFGAGAAGAGAIGSDGAIHP